MNTAPIIAAEGLALGYGREPVLSDVRWRVARGEAWFLLGPNGRGKSTLLKAIMGGLTPLAGTLHVACDRNAIGFVPQRCDLNPALPTTVREFVSLGLVGLKVRAVDEKLRMCRALERVGLADLASADYWSLSGGQRQRALLARALIREPDLLILDEPTNGLDVPSEEALLACLDTLRAGTGITVLFVTHDLALAARHATHVALFGRGTLETGPRAELLAPERLARIFGMEVGRVA